MKKPRLILCGGAKFYGDENQKSAYNIVELASSGRNANINIRLEDVAKIFLRHLSPRLVDLIEIASYIYTADCLALRDGAWAGGSIEPWSRTFEFIIPVRDSIFWNQQEVKNLLYDTLRFLSDDLYSFSFEENCDTTLVQSYLEFGQEEDWPFYNVERAIMFSGGLDSLAGALETASRGENLVLVSHRAAPTLSKRQCNLFSALQEFFPNVKMLHIPVWVNKDKNLGREHTQRTRSFLYAALGAAVAHSLNAKGLRFFENGIVSLNLPVADEVLRARASRTTHPISLNLMSKLLSLVFEQDFCVDNPYIFMTKTEVVDIINRVGASALIKSTCSCAHTGFFQSKTQWHCGTCSQCIDRRIAIIAAGLEYDDPEHDYVVDVFHGERNDGYEKNMAVDYIRHAYELHRMSEAEMAAKFSLELSRAVRNFPGSRREVADKFIQMHKRHGSTVTEVLQHQISASASKLIAGELPMKSMLMCVAWQQHLSSSWTRYAERISNLLKSGVPIACSSHKPSDEPHLQEICDGILKAQDSDLIREFPFMRWSSVMTKPDWSVDNINLWVELKYIRKKTDIRPITEAIAADLTKYSDNGRKTLYVVYDPVHLIVNEKEFSHEIVKRGDTRVTFIR